MQGIYIIINKKNNNKYIGQSCHINKRWKEHIWASNNKNDSAYNYPICRAIRKYGVSNFKFEVIEEVTNDKIITKREEYWYNLLKPEYNQLHQRDK